MKLDYAKSGNFSKFKRQPSPNNKAKGIRANSVGTNHDNIKISFAFPELHSFPKF